MYLADRLMFHLVATIVSLYKVEPLEGEKVPDRKSVEYSPKAVQYESFLLIITVLIIDLVLYRQPVGFMCRFVLRDEKARHLLKTISLGE
jgi:hypothetical protein